MNTSTMYLYVPNVSVFTSPWVIRKIRDSDEDVRSNFNYLYCILNHSSLFVYTFFHISHNVFIFIFPPTLFVRVKSSPKGDKRYSGWGLLCLHSVLIELNWTFFSSLTQTHLRDNFKYQPEGTICGSDQGFKSKHCSLSTQYYPFCIKNINRWIYIFPS